MATNEMRQTGGGCLWAITFLGAAVLVTIVVGDYVSREVWGVRPMTLVREALGMPPLTINGEQVAPTPVAPTAELLTAAQAQATAQAMVRAALGARPAQVVQPPAVYAQPAEAPASAPAQPVATPEPPPPPQVVVQPVVVRDADGGQQTFVTGSGACRAHSGVARRCVQP